MGGRKVAITALALVSLFLPGCSYQGIMDMVKSVASIDAPVFSKAEGVYNNDIAITMSCATEGALIHYTVDGSAPTEAYGTPYQGAPIPITATKTIKAVAYRPGSNASAVTTAVYTLKAATPTFGPDGGIYGGTQNVSMTTVTTSATIRYTINGTDPTAGTLYSTPVPVSDTTTLKARAFRTDYEPSDIGTAVYTIGTVSPPYFIPASGDYPNDQSVTIDCGTPGVEIWYTTNGVDPVKGVSPLYTAPVTVAPSNSTLKAIATYTGLANSPLATASYTFTAAAPTFSPVAGTYVGTQSVTIATQTSGATIYYTTNGSIPDAGDTAYTGPVSVDATKTLRALATKVGYTDSGISDAAYTIRYSLTITATTGGTFTPTSPQAVDHGAATNISATPNTGYYFVNWTVTSGSGATFGNANAASTTVTLTAGAATIRTNFAALPAQVYVSDSGSDSNNGFTTSTPKRTVAAGISTAVANGIGAVWVSTGSYPFTAGITMSPGVSVRGGWNTAFTTQNPALYPTTVSATTPIVLVTAADTGITTATVFEGFNLNVTTSSTGHLYGVITVSPGSSPTIRNNKIFVTQSVADGSRVYGIYINGDANPVVQDNWVTIYRTNCTIAPSAQGIVIGGHASSTGVIIERNRVAVYSSTQRADGITVSVCSGKQVIKNNFISVRCAGSMAMGITIDYSAAIIANNTVIAYADSGSQYGIYHHCNATYPYDSYIGNNIFGTRRAAGYEVYIQENYGQMWLVANSIFLFTTTHLPSSIIVSDTQNVYTASDVFDSVFAGTYDADFSNGDSTDYHLDPADTTYAYNKGIDTSGATWGSVTNDIDVQARPRSTYWDIGADER